MFLNDSEWDRSEFDRRTDGKWEQEALEAFKCSSCGQVYLGVPDCHMAFPDPIDLTNVIDYNAIRPPLCRCGKLIYDPAMKKRDKSNVTMEEFLASGWRELFGKCR